MAGVYQNLEGSLPGGPSTKEKFQVAPRFKFVDENGAWIKDQLEDSFWPMGVAQILLIRPSPRCMRDFLAWRPERSGSFTVHSAYWLATSNHDDVSAGGSSSSHPGGERLMLKVLWRTLVLQK